MANRADRFRKAKSLASSLHDDDIKKYITSKWYRPCFIFPEDDPLLWIKITFLMRLKPSIKNTPEKQRELPGSTLRDQYAEPPRARIPELFRKFQATDFKAIAMKPVQGPTLNWLMRCEYHVIDALFGWVPTPHQKIHDHLIDLSVSERQLSDYADAIGLVLSLPVQMDAAPGPVGGGHSQHLIFENKSLEKSPNGARLDHAAPEPNSGRKTLTSSAPAISKAVAEELDDTSSRLVALASFIIQSAMHKEPITLSPIYSHHHRSSASSWVRAAYIKSAFRSVTV
ncbi:hypothetical protein F4860DRAFT_522268 [Xylaria cubensis]|nr:hypothetical protein F4860DRAFT_522268 [Xylaria cubensis]